MQVSDNAVAYDDGQAVVVFPSPGHSKTPTGLGSGVRTGLAERLGLPLAASMADDNWEGCPVGIFAHWYCFYQFPDFEGTRWQFRFDPGNDNQMSSWNCANV